MRRALIVLGIVLLALVAAWRVSRLTTWQAFCEIVARVETTEPVVALTFDDGPTPGGTDAILAALAARGVRATFFLTGAETARHPEAARRIVAAGHQIANHSWSHERMVLRSQRWYAVRMAIRRRALRARRAARARSPRGAPRRSGAP